MEQHATAFAIEKFDQIRIFQYTARPRRENPRRNKVMEVTSPRRPLRGARLSQPATGANRRTAMHCTLESTWGLSAHRSGPSAGLWPPSTVQMASPSIDRLSWAGSVSSVHVRHKLKCELAKYSQY